MWLARARLLDKHYAQFNSPDEFLPLMGEQAGVICSSDAYTTVTFGFIALLFLVNRLLCYEYSIILHSHK